MNERKEDGSTLCEFTKTILNSQPIAPAGVLVHSWGMVLKRLCWRVSQG
jgi:hypothetical protein